MFPTDEQDPFGWMEETQWAAYARWMAAQGLIDDATVAARGFTNEYLAGQGVGDDDGGGQSVQGI